MNEPAIINLSGYAFVPLDNLNTLQSTLKASLSQAGVKGAVVVASEGINVAIAGTQQQADAATHALHGIPPFQNLWLKSKVSSFVPHKRLRVRVRTEIIAFDGVSAVADSKPKPIAPSINAQTLDEWLDSNKALTLLDTRNDYEIVSGTFRTAQHLNLKHFRHFKEAVQAALADGKLDKSQPMVTFCTGGIRCEKAAPWLLAEGFEEVYQIEGGVLNYLNDTKADHWQGDCFVFDNRVELTPELEPTGAGLCDRCQLAVPEGSECHCQLGVHHHATYE